MCDCDCVYLSRSFTTIIVTEAYEAATYSMARLNRTGAKLMQKYGKCTCPESPTHSVARLASTSRRHGHPASSLAAGAHGATDVTGFGILGHARNLAASQKASVSFKINTLPSECRQWVVLAKVFFSTAAAAAATIFPATCT